MDSIQYCSAYIRVLILLLAAKKVALSYIVTDKSVSQHCGKGLLAGKDTIRLEIQMNMAEATIAENGTFFLWYIRPFSSEKFELCNVTYSSPCVEVSDEICYCESLLGNTSTFVYKSTAYVTQSGNLLFINDQQLSAFEFPKVYGEGRVTLAINMQSQPLGQDCMVRVAPASTALFRFCTYELELPNLYVTYGGFIERTQSNCLAVAFCVHNQSKVIDFTYEDKCGRINSTTCTVKVEEKTTLAPEVTTTAGMVVTSSYSWIQIILIFSGIVVLIFAVTVIYWQLKETWFVGVFGESVSKSEAFQSSPVDGANASERSSLRKLTRFSFKQSSSMTSGQKTKPRSQEYGTPVDFTEGVHT